MLPPRCELAYVCLIPAPCLVLAQLSSPPITSTIQVVSTPGSSYSKQTSTVLSKYVPPHTPHSKEEKASSSQQAGSLKA
jgi:hypothetical protein